jgi:transposase-like protein
MHKHKREAKIKGRGTVGKAIVMGILNRSKDRKTKEEKRKKVGDHSTVHAEVVPNAKKVTVQPIVRKVVEPGATVYTDELQSYDGLTEYVHRVINHSKEYVGGNIHTNGMENFWSLFGRCVRGTYVSVEPDHLNRYVAEEVFRFNQREIGDGGRLTTALGKISGKRLTYKQLIGATPAD